MGRVTGATSRDLTERLYRIEDTNGDGVADRSQIMIDGFNSDPTNDIAGGVLHHNGDWFLGASPALWRLRDQNGDGFIDSQVAISEGYNVHPAFGGHGMSGVTLGPDGRIYWEVGDMGFDVVDQTGRRWSSPNQGAVLRANPDGSDFEVFATGIRNLQEFAFDEYGNLISVDNDGDHPGETERLVYLTEGSDSGWRANWQYGKYTDPDNNRYNVWMDEGMFKPRFEGQPAHMTPPIAPYHPGPAGMAYEPGTALSDEWRRHFFVASFRGSASNAVIRAFRLRNGGRGVRARERQGPASGHPDGRPEVRSRWRALSGRLDYGMGLEGDGRIWRVAAPAAATPSAAQREVRSLLAGSLEARTATDVGLLLQHADMRVRLKAQFELVRRADITTLRLTARRADQQLARIHGLWGIAQLARKDPQHSTLLAEFLDRSRSRNPGASRQDGRRCARCASRRRVAAAARRQLAAGAVLRGRSARPAGLPTGGPRPRPDAGRQQRHRRQPAARGQSRPCPASATSRLWPRSRSHASRAVRIAAIVALRRMRDPASRNS